MSASPEELRNEYEMRFSALSDYRKEIWKILVKDFFQKRIDPESTVLDLGCGWGEFINHIQAKKKYGMDLNDDSRKKIVPEVELIQQDCSERWGIGDESLDTVFTSNFFEHLRNKPALDATLGEALRCLKPGGRIICLGPNIKYVGNDYWDFYDHYTCLSHLSLEEALRMRGFEVLENIPRFLPYTMAQGKLHPLFFVKCYLRFPLMWRIIGKQFLVTARKPL